MKRFIVVLAWLFVCTLSGCAHPTHPTRITILHTNDHHGRFWRNGDDEYGLAARKRLIESVRAQVRAEGGHVLLLDGGDVNTGVPESDLQQAEPDFKGMSAIGYDAMAVGNHEFDKSLAVLQRQRREWSSFPWLSANVYLDGQRMFEPYRIFRVGPVRVAVLGLTTDDTTKTLSRERFPGVDVRAPAGEAAALVPVLRGQADVVIAATHMGHYVDGRHGVNAPGDVELARAVGGIDLIVGGHSQNPVCMLDAIRRNEDYRPGEPCAPDRQNGTWIVQAWEWGKYVGRADFEYEAGQFRLVRYALLPVNLMQRGVNAEGKPVKLPPQARIEEDAGMLELLAPFQQRGADTLLQPVGRSDGAFDGERRNVRSRPTSLGRLITASMLERTGADLAIVSSGGIRDSLPSGVLTYRDLLKVLPFGNRVVVATLNGSELETYLRAVLRMTPGSGAFAQTSGVSMLMEAGEPKDIRVQGHSIEPGRSYRLALSSFIAKGGDGYPALSQQDVVDTGFVDVEVLRDFVAKRPGLASRDFEPVGGAAAQSSGL
jgi:5'-nucleotidase/UDP-sugar diphosphatase